jgi:hypothetical protein
MKKKEAQELREIFREYEQETKKRLREGRERRKKLTAAEKMKEVQEWKERMRKYAERAAELKQKRFLVSKFMRLIVSAGRKSLAEKYHPDRGGTQEEMAAINEAKTELDRLLNEEEKTASGV